MPGVDQETHYHRWTSSGIYTIDGKDKDKGEYLDVPFPVGVGSKWTSESPSETDHYEVIGTETIVLPEHTYKDCLKITFNDHPKSGQHQCGTEYLAGGIGMVKTDVVGGISITIQQPKEK